MTDFVKKVRIEEQGVTLDVDTLSTELATSGEIDTSVDTSPKTILTPASGKKVYTRTAVLHTDSNQGEVAMKYATTGNIIAKVYGSVRPYISVSNVNFEGAVNEAIQIEWSGVTSGAKIFYALSYKEA